MVFIRNLQICLQEEKFVLKTTTRSAWRGSHWPKLGQFEHQKIMIAVDQNTLNINTWWCMYVMVMMMMSWKLTDHPWGCWDQHIILKICEGKLFFFFFFLNIAYTGRSVEKPRRKDGRKCLHTSWCWNVKACCLFLLCVRLVDHQWRKGRFLSPTGDPGLGGSLCVEQRVDLTPASLLTKSYNPSELHFIEKNIGMIITPHSVIRLHWTKGLKAT